MVTPGLAQAVGTIIARQPDIATDRHNELPSLPSFDWPSVVISLGIKEESVLRILDNILVSLQIFIQRFPYTIINSDLMALSPFLLLDPEPSLRYPQFINEVTDLQLQQIRDTQCSVDSYHEQQ